MIPETVQEVQRRILDRMGIGIDNNAGSYDAVLAGAVAEEIVTLQQNIYLLKTQGHPLVTDAASLGLMGRSIGVFIFAAAGVDLEIEVGEETKLPEYTVITAKDTGEQYTVMKPLLTSNRYHITSAATGTERTVIPYEWYSEVVFTSPIPEHAEFRARVVQILCQGQDAETANEFRARVYAAHMTRPFNENADWMKSYLIQTFTGIGVVRLQAVEFLTDQNHAKVNVYIGGHDLAPVTSYTLERARKGLESLHIIGTDFSIESVNRMAGSGKLEIDITYNQAGGMPHVPEIMKSSVVKMLQENFKNLAKNTYPLDPVEIDVPLLQGRIASMLMSYASDFTVKITYLTMEHTDKFSLSPNDVPWATEDSVKIHPKGSNAIETVPSV